jgi:uncharacterized protein (TIGR02678 family)
VNDDVRDAARRLLRTPVVLASVAPELHRNVRRNEDDRASMFRTYLGYRLQVDARIARLYKAGLDPAVSRPLTRAPNLPFTPRDYTYLALICGVLLTTRSQLLLSALVEDVRQAAVEAGVDAGVDSLVERRALVHALRYLIELGAVTEDAGSVGGFADDSAAEALLWIERDAIRAVLSTPLREVDAPADLIRTAARVDTDSLRHAVRRKIVENPVVMLDELTDTEVAWLRQDQRREAQILERNLGLILEIRAEGVAAIDPADELTDIHFPGDGTRAQAALLTVGKLVTEFKPSATSRAPAVAVPLGAVESIVNDLVAVHRSRWSKEYVEHPDRLTADVEELLAGTGLLRRCADGARHLTAVAARYTPEPIIEEPPALFEVWGT